MLRFYQRFIWGILIGLSACSTIPEKKTTSSETSSELTPVLSLSGRFAITFVGAHEGSKPPDGLSNPLFGKFNWTAVTKWGTDFAHIPCQVECLELLSPLDQQFAYIVLDEMTVKVKTKKDENERSMSFDEIKQKYPNWFELMKISRKLLREVALGNRMDNQSIEQSNQTIKLNVLKRKENGATEKLEVLLPVDSSGSVVRVLWIFN
jgi:hypothetical protein